MNENNIERLLRAWSEHTLETQCSRSVLLP